MTPSRCDVCEKYIPTDEPAMLVSTATPWTWRHVGCVKAIETALRAMGVEPYKHPLNHEAQRAALEKVRADLKEQP